MTTEQLTRLHYIDFNKASSNPGFDRHIGKAMAHDEPSARHIGQAMKSQGFDVRIRVWNDNAEEYSELVL